MDLNKLSKEQLINCVRFLLGDDLEVRGHNAQKKQIKELVEWFEENSLVNNISDKDDKKFDRLKGFFTDMPTRFKELKSWGNSILPIDMEGLEDISDSDARASIMIED